MSACIEKIIRKDKTSTLILEINALCSMVQLGSIASVTSPVNRGMTFLIDSLLKSTLRKHLEERNIDPSMSWLKIIEIIAKGIELYNIFQRDDILQCLVASIRLMMSYTNEQIKAKSLQLHIDPDLAIPFIHRKILSLLETESGICVHYASYAIHHLIQAGIRPVGSVWLFDKESPTWGNPSGHNIVIIGLHNQDEYVNLANMDALIFDYWNGGIYSTRNAFSSGGPLEQYDESRILLILHVNKDEMNPFPLITPNLYFKNRLQKGSLDVSQRFLSIIKERIAKGEEIKDVISWISEIPDKREKQVCLDWDDSERHQNSLDVSERLMRYEKSAMVIQSAWRFFSSKKTQSSDAPLSYQPAQP